MKQAEEREGSGRCRLAGKIHDTSPAIDVDNFKIEWFFLMELEESMKMDAPTDKA